MRRMNVYLTEPQIKFLNSVDSIKLSEHIRRAIDDYVDTLRSWDACASASKIINKQKQPSAGIKACKRLLDKQAIEEIAKMGQLLNQAPIPTSDRYIWDAKTNKTHHIK